MGVSTTARAICFSSCHTEDIRLRLLALTQRHHLQPPNTSYATRAGALHSPEAAPLLGRSDLGVTQPRIHPLQRSRYGEPCRRDGVDQIHLGFLGGVTVEEVLGSSKVMVSALQVLAQPLHSLPIAELWHPPTL